jgi:hypothetical protein
MKNTINEENIKPTLSKPVNKQSQGFEKNFKKTMVQNGVTLNETDGLLSEAEQSLKKKIFSLAKMEALVFADPKLAAVYEQMSENGEEKYGYHYNETIMNMLFNDYVLNSPKYLQKYKQAIPKEKKRRDASGINQLKKAGEETMQHSTETPKPKKLAPSGLKPAVAEEVEESTKVQFLVNEKDPKDPDLFAYFPDENYDKSGNKMAYSHIGQHSAASPQYAAESRPATPEEYAGLKAELEGLGYVLEVVNPTNEMTGAASSGSFAAPMGFNKELDETTGTGGAGGAGDSGSNSSGTGQYSGPSAWGSGDLMKTKGKSKIMRKPIWKGGTIIQESNYLIETNGFAEFIEMLNEDVEREDSPAENAIITQPKTEIPTGVWDKIQVGGRKAAADAADAKIIDKTSAFTSDTVKDWDGADTSTELDTIDTGDPDKVNLQAMEESKNINEKAASKKQQKFMGMAHAVQKGELNPEKVGGDVAKAADTMKKSDAEDFASTKHKGLPEKVKPKKVNETEASMIDDKQNSMSNKSMATGTQGTGNVPMGMQNTGGGGMNEDFALLEELNNELNAYSIHHNKLKLMAEDRKPSALVLRDRVGSENEQNFKKDFNNSDTKETIDVMKELQYKDQQTEVGKDPMKLGQDIEDKEIKVTDAKSGEALKNVGDSANDKGDEIPKRNLTTEEQEEVNMYRLGQHSLVYDNKPNQKFEDRMKADMGETLYDQRRKQMEFRGKAPMYNKDPQPVEDTTAKKVQFDKEQTGWNEREGLKEGMVTGRYADGLNKRRLIDFTLAEVTIITADKLNEGLFELDFTGLGNSYNGKTTNKQVTINETAVKAMNENKFYTDGKKIFAMKNPVQNLNENEQVVQKPAINEQFEKMKHLTGYKPNNFVSTKGIKL